MPGQRFAVILAAGKGTRMKSKLYKVLHPVCGKPMVEHVLDEVTKAGISNIVTVVGHGAELVKEQLGNRSTFALQQEQLGTAHAVAQAEEALAEKEGITLVVCGDTPLLTAETFQSLISHHKEANAKGTVLTAVTKNPTGYGRIVRDTMGNVERIVEQKDATEEEKQITEINTGTYSFDNALLFEALKKIDNDNAQGEYYLTDILEVMKADGHIISAYQTENFDETLGVNDRVALSQAEQLMKARINKQHMINGVTIIDPANTYISADAVIGTDTVLHPGTMIHGKTEIGSDCIIGPFTEIKDCKIGNNNHIYQSMLEDSIIDSNSSIGPFAHIRPASHIQDKTKIGNFVEVKKAVIGHGSKVSHLSYIGDAEVGKDVNIGCGSITVNYDGKNKFKTIIEDEAFIGCNSNLIAPVTVKRGAYVAAGSTITDEVPEEAMAIARARQINKEGYVKTLKEKQNKHK